jgi:hypothetical protein
LSRPSGPDFKLALAQHGEFGISFGGFLKKLHAHPSHGSLHEQCQFIIEAWVSALVL